MAHRIHLERTPGSVRIRFEGVLDAAALGEIAAVARAAGAGASRAEVTLVLERGTEVDAECIDPLRRLDGVRVRPASAFLARWLSGAS